jgi:hypothetical protein
LPFEYDDINLDYVYNIHENMGTNIQIIVSKNNKYGTVDIVNNIKIPLEYKYLKRISSLGIFKAKINDKYKIVDLNNNEISTKLVDDASDTERKIGLNGRLIDYIFLTFEDGKISPVDENINYINDTKIVKLHNGFTTFDELKNALIVALQDPEDDLLKEFCVKITPSEQLLYFLKENIYNKSKLFVDIPLIKKKYCMELLEFKNKEWNKSSFNKSSFINSIDTTGYTKFGVSNKTQNNSYYDVRVLENFLKNSIKVNGFWISSYFMKESFFN